MQAFHNKYFSVQVHNSAVVDVSEEKNGDIILARKSHSIGGVGNLPAAKVKSKPLVRLTSEGFLQTMQDGHFSLKIQNCGSMYFYEPSLVGKEEGLLVSVMITS